MPYSPVNPPWTPADEQVLIDTYSTQTAQQQSDRLGRQRSDVVAKRARMVKKGQLSIYDRAYLPHGRPSRTRWLRDNYHRHTMAYLVKKLGRTAVAITLKKKRLGIRRTDGYYTCRSLAEIFGGDPKRIAAWYEQGFLTGKRAPYLQGSNRPWVFSEEDVEQLIHKYPWLLRPEKMQQHYFRSMVREEWERDPWYSSKEAAEIVGVNSETVMRRLRSGEIPGFQRSPNSAWSLWWIRRSDLLTHFKRHDTRDARSARTSQQRRKGRLAKGLPTQVATVWMLVCQDCAEQFTVEAPTRARSPEVLGLALAQHQCPNRQEVAA